MSSSFEYNPTLCTQGIYGFWEESSLVVDWQPVIAEKRKKEESNWIPQKVLQYMAALKEYSKEHGTLSRRWLFLAIKPQHNSRGQIWYYVSYHFKNYTSCSLQWACPNFVLLWQHPTCKNKKVYLKPHFFLLQHNACVAVGESACILISLTNHKKWK